MGDTALIEVDAYLGEEFKGVVTEIANSANSIGSSADQVTNFDVKVRILKSSYVQLMSNGQNPFRPGMTATVDIRTNVVKNVPAVPISAVTTRSDTSTASRSYRSKNTASESPDDEDEMYEVVFVWNEGKAALQVVETGVQDDRYIQILNGLAAETKIISGPYDVVSKRLKNGSSVALRNKKREDETQATEESADQ
jgi:HlyD family secretion protein